jgi:hypothetical protein
MAKDHIYDLAVQLLDVARDNQAKIFDLERQGGTARASASARA